MRILLVDDQPSNLLFGEKILKKYGYDVTVARNGREALHAWEQERFDLILIDIRMPVMDGIQATHYIREREKGTGRHTPIIAATAHALREERESILAEGFDGYLAKPFLIEDLRRCLPESGSPDEHSPLSAAPENSHHPSAAGLLLTPMLVATLGSDPDLLAAYPGILLNDLEASLAAMERACAAGDCAALGRAAHAAKGVARGLRDGEPERLAQEIELQSRTGSVAAARERVSRLGTLCATLRQSVSGNT